MPVMMKLSISGQAIKMSCVQAQPSCGPGLIVGHAEAPALATSQLSEPNSFDEVQD